MYRNCHLSATLPSCMRHPPNQFNLLLFFSTGKDLLSVIGKLLMLSER